MDATLYFASSTAACWENPTPACRPASASSPSLPPDHCAKLARRPVPAALRAASCDPDVVVDQKASFAAMLRSSSTPVPCPCHTKPLLKAHGNIRSDHHNYRWNTPNTLFRPRITPLCQDIRDTLMSRFSALAARIVSSHSFRPASSRLSHRKTAGPCLFPQNCVVSLPALGKKGGAITADSPCSCTAESRDCRVRISLHVGDRYPIVSRRSYSSTSARMKNFSSLMLLSHPCSSQGSSHSTHPRSL